VWMVPSWPILAAANDHLDEMFVRINGATDYLWRAVDHEGEVLDAFVSKRRDRRAALNFLRKALRRHGWPEIVVTDRLRSYGAALRAVRAERRQRCLQKFAPPMPRSTTTSIRSAISSVDPSSSEIVPLLLPSGVWHCLSANRSAALRNGQVSLMSWMAPSTSVGDARHEWQNGHVHEHGREPVTCRRSPPSG
jgi:hypothetical protein